MDRAAKLTLLARVVPRSKDRAQVEAALDRLVPVLWLVPATGVDHGHHLGGRPSLMAGSEWPVHEGRSLPYLLGLDLNRLPAWAGFPDRGILHLFGGFSRVKAVLVPAGSVVVELEPPSLPWLDGDPEAGTCYDRSALEAVPGLWLAGASAGDGEMDDDGDEDLLDHLRVENAIARIGGAGPSWGSTLDDAQEICYLHEQRRERLCYHTSEKVNELDRLIDAAQSVQRVAPFVPPPAPPAVAERLMVTATILQSGVQSMAGQLGTKDMARLEPLVASVKRSVAQIAAPVVAGADRLAGDYYQLAVSMDQLVRQLTSSKGKAASAVAAAFPGSTLADLRGSPAAGGQKNVPAIGDMSSMLKQMNADLAGFAKSMRASLERGSNPDAPLSDDPAQALKELQQRVAMADMTRDPQRIQAAWQQLEDHLQAHAATLPLEDLSWSLRERNRTAHNLNAYRHQQQGESPEELIARREDLRWWHAGIDSHSAAMKRWQPLLTVYSSGQFCWSDSGLLMVYGDPERVARGEVGHLQGMVESS